MRVEIPRAAHQLLKRFKVFNEQMRIAPPDAFAMYDGGRNGTLPAFKVQAAFNNISFPVLQTEVERLVMCFRDARRPELFNYVGFFTVWQLLT